MVKVLIGLTVAIAIKLAYLGTVYSLVFYLEEPEIPKSLLK